MNVWRSPGPLIVLRFGDVIEVQGECPFCPVWEIHNHRINPETQEVDRSDFWVEP